jgi:hypothetical protein
MHLALLLRRRYPPYGKWTGSAFARLPDATALGPAVTGALRAADWHDREEHLCRAYEYLGGVQNALGIAAPVDPTRRPFFSRPFQVIGAGRFVDALLGAITDPVVRGLPLIGSVDQVADSTDVRTQAGRARAITRALYR